MINFSLRGQLEECQGQLYDQLVPNYKSLTSKVCSIKVELSWTSGGV